MDQINNLISENLSQICLPPVKFEEIFKTCVPYPTLNILKTKFLPQISQENLKFQKFEFENFYKYLGQMAITENACEESIVWSIKQESKSDILRSFRSWFRNVTGNESSEPEMSHRNRK